MAALPSPEPLDRTFTAPIQKDGAFTTFVILPGSDGYLGTRRAVKIGGTIDGHPFNATLTSSGTGPHMLPLRAAICKLIGQDQAGSEVSVHLQERFS
ncbi:DUF1905 domain-containing protein [Arthrobacter sp. 35W]|uniref:DUF1905 domain-containing protein n=1 Tax=Arthrobacter sp. 35W TaxID=1132441 RepID=UPI00041739E6|nr:DUF1905 domain-containing protein [Arthrobacter sp. 35W]